MTTLKINMAITQDYYSQTMLVQWVTWKLKMPIKILAAIKKCLTLVITQISQNIMIIQTN